MKLRKRLGSGAHQVMFFFFFFFFPAHFFSFLTGAKVKHHEFVQVLEQKIMKEPASFPKTLRESVGLNAEVPTQDAANKLALQLVDNFSECHPEKKTLSFLAGSYRKNIQFTAFQKALKDDIAWSKNYAERLTDLDDAEVIRAEMTKKRRNDDPSRPSEALWDDLFRLLEGNFVLFFC